jgi:hypothetical protein
VVSWLLIASPEVELSGSFYEPLKKYAGTTAALRSQRGNSSTFFPALPEIERRQYFYEAEASYRRGQISSTENGISYRENRRRKAS